LIKIKFLGATGTVTGSMYLFDVDGRKFLLESGLFQGPRELEERNYREFNFDPAEIEYIILTHGHLDHIGILPRLVREGFTGEIVTTPATRDIASIMLIDAAKIQEEEAYSISKRNMRKGLPPVAPLYDSGDAVLTLRHFTKMVNYGETFTIFDSVKVTFRDAGHILGSSFIEMEFENGKKLVFSGDLGNYNKPIVRDPDSPVMKDADFVIMETTYGNREHRSIEESVAELREAIIDTFERGGNVIIPSFALERAQDILYYLREFYEEGSLPEGVQVFLDSPLAISATHIFRAHPECFDDETRELIKRHRDPFSFPGLKFTRSVEESKKINNIKSGAIIIAGSGMCTGGRIKHHLKHNLWREEASVVFVGYQARGTLGRDIVDGKEKVTIYGEEVRVRARVYTINGFSSHAGRDGLLNWALKFENPEFFLVHGEHESQEAFASLLREHKRSVTIPGYGEEITI